MNRTIAQKFINYIQAFADGKTIQAKPARCNESRWEDCDNPSWSLDYEYRIKPETVYRSFKDCDELIKTYDKLSLGLILDATDFIPNGSRLNNPQD